MNTVITQFYRGRIIESSHNIKAFISRLNGDVLLDTNNQNDLIYPRSSIKIFQAIPFIISQADIKFKLNKKQLALACSSHRGQHFHLKELNGWIKKIGLNRSKLKCGLHNPLNKEASEIFLRSNKKLHSLYNNCAGKHLAMLCACLAKKQNIEDYLDFNHPHQETIRYIFEVFSESSINNFNYSVDGCSAPQYSFKIKSLSVLLTNLLKSYENKYLFNHETKKLLNAILNNPNFIGGTDSLDSRIISISNKTIFCKGGAEGVFLFIHLTKKIVGIIKVTDGNERALPSAVYNIFKKLNIMKKDQLVKLHKLGNFNLNNHANIKTGEIKTKIK